MAVIQLEGGGGKKKNERGTEKQKKLGQGWISTSMLHSAVAV